VKHAPSITTRNFWLSAVAGGYGGIFLQTAIVLLYEPVDFSELWATPVIILVYGLIALPFTALGIALFGLPVANVLLSKAEKWWIGLVAILWGAASGKLMFWAVDHFLFMGFYQFWKIQLLDMGLIYGIPTALAFWLLLRREIGES